MAYLKIADESPEAAQERALAGKTQSAAVRADISARVQLGGEYNNRTVEIPTIDHKALGRPVDVQYDRNLASVRSRLKAIGVAPATVANFLPMTLTSTSYIDTLRKAKVLAPRDSEPYSTFLISREEIVPTRMGADSPLLAFDIHPIQLADEFVQVYGGLGGVMVFPGVPSDMDKPGWGDTISAFHGGRTYGDVLEECRVRAIGWMRQQLANGNNKRSMGLQINILGYEKEAARRLMVLGDITELPNWTEEQRDLNVKRHSCPKCQKPVDPGIAQCLQPNCGFIVNPRLAYEIGAIAEDHIALERLTREEIVQMGISDYVAETIDEKPARTALGVPKPKSLAVMRLEQITEELDEDAKKRAAAQNATLIADAIAKGGDTKTAEQKKE